MYWYLSQLLVNISVIRFGQVLVESRSYIISPVVFTIGQVSVTQQIDQQSVMIASVMCWECVSGASVNNQHRLYNFFTNLISKAFPLQGYKVFVKWYEVDSINSYTTHGLF